MAISTCPKCSNTSFELKENSPKGSQFKFMFMQCSVCGCVVGITEYYHVPTLLQKIAKKLGFDIHS